MTREKQADAEAAQAALREGLARAKKLIGEARKAIDRKPASPPKPDGET